MMAWRLPGARITTVEAQERSIRLARKSIRYNGLENRFDCRFGDLREVGVLSAHERFDLITGSPPYFPLSDGVISEHPQKVECRFETRGDVRDYCARAAQHLAPGGMFFLVFPKVQEIRLLGGAEASGLIVLRSRAVILKEGDAPLLGLYQLGRRADFPDRFSPDRSISASQIVWEEPPLVIRAKSGGVHTEYSVVKLSLGFPP
jgi:tRNA1(Val) A37 N6-methylase TrmN6